MSTYANLEHRRAGYLGRITKIQTFVAEYDPVFSTTNELKSKKEILTKVYANHEQVIIQMYDHEDADQDKIAEEVDRFETAYCVALGAIEDKLQSMESPPSLSDSPTQQVKQKLQVKLPVITLPEFDGTFDRWLQYRDIFESMVHKNESLPDMQKYQYLITSLKLPAGQPNVLSNFSLAETSYQDAWTAVKDRYDDKKKLKHHLITNLLTIKKMTNETPLELRRILDSFSSTITTLTQLGTTWDNLLVHVVQFRLDDQTLKDWQKLNSDKEGSWEEMRAFLKTQWRIMDQLPQQKKPVQAKSAEYKSTPSPQSKSHAANSAFSMTCSLCKEGHRLFQCSKFQAMSPSERYHHVKVAKLCRNCFAPDHMAQACKNPHRCRLCNQLHHSMIHFDKPNYSTPPSVPYPVPNATSANSASKVEAPKPHPQVQQQSAQNIDPFDPSSSFCSAKNFDVNEQSILSTMQFNVMDANGELQLCRALLDSGSQDHYVTTRFAHKLGLKLHDTHVSVVGISDKVTIVKHQLFADISSTYEKYEQKGIKCLVMPKITGLLPGRPINVKKLSIPPECYLADPAFHTPAEVDMLIGNKFFYNLQHPELIELPGGIEFKHTKFGWILSGGFTVASPSMRSSSFLSSFSSQCHVGIEEVDAKLERFMEIENVGTSKKVLSAEEKYCEELYQRTTKRDENGRFIVQLPCKSNIKDLGNNYDNARRQFFYQEKKREQDEELNKMYVDYMEEYISSRHMEPVDPSLKHEGYYLPQHGVKKITSTTTKMRPVSNASCKSETGLSLNDCLCVGPTVQPESFDILIRFREKPYVLKADIEKMYRQVFVEPTQRKYQKVLWRRKSTDPLNHFQANGLVFGMAPSAYLGTRSINQIGMDNEEAFPIASQIIMDSFYVDDLMFGCESIEEGLQLRNQIRLMLSKSCMPSRKWASSDNRLLEKLLPQELEEVEDESTSIKTLGLNWFPHHDQLSLNIKPMKDGNEVLVNRHAVIANPVRVEFHGFADASEEGYGAVIYIRSLDTIGNIQVTLICSKSRVSPPKQKSIARLELCAGVLLIKLMARIIEVSSLTPDEILLWSDSMIVLYWILTDASKLSVFVGNRVALIQELIKKFKLIWNHIRGEWNPADVISRGRFPEEISQSEPWWNGPSFFSLPRIEWPQTMITINNDDPDYSSELRKCIVTSKVDSFFIGIETRVSRLQVLINAYALCRRALRNAKKDAIKVSGSFSTEERDEATLCIIRIVQRMMFPKEYEYFIAKCEEPSSSITFPTKSEIKDLSPIMNKEDLVIRVGGRLQASPGLTEDQKHPIVLPSGHFAKLIVRDLHKKHHHPGNLALLGIVREKYWPLGARNIIKKVAHECLICFRVKPQFGTQIMGSLPEARVTMSPPFLATTVDYAGHFNLRSSFTNKNSIVKAWVAMFKCMSTGAIHLEAVTSLSTEAFIAAFDRFISRRGLSSDIFSDNGTNFVGANNEIKKIVSEIEPKIAEHLQEKSIKWHFSCPLAPHAGGYYESGIKTMKHHLIRVMADRSFDFEQFTTVLHKIEAIINSRPLTPMSDDPNDFKALTPAHFLIGRMLIAKPERNYIPVNQNRLDKWNQLQQIQQKFWNFWYHDYLHHLQSRPNKFRDKQDYHIGDMVLIKDANLPPLKWFIGRINQLFPGKDRVVRNVKVRYMKQGKPHYIDRHVKYLCFLPIESPSSPAPENVANRKT